MEVTQQRLEQFAAYPEELSSFGDPRFQDFIIKSMLLEELLNLPIGTKLSPKILGEFYNNLLLAKKYLADILVELGAEFEQKNANWIEQEKDKYTKCANKLLAPFEKLFIQTSEKETDKILKIQHILLSTITAYFNYTWQVAASKNGYYLDVGKKDEANKVISKLHQRYAKLNVQFLFESEEDNRIGITSNALFNAIYERTKQQKATILANEKRAVDVLAARDLEFTKYSVNFSESSIKQNYLILLDEIEKYGPAETLLPIQFDEKKRSLLLIASNEGKLQVVNKIHELYYKQHPELKGKLINNTDPEGKNILHHLLMKSSNFWAFEQLCKTYDQNSIKDFLNKKDHFKNMPHHYASAYGNIDIIKKIFDLGVNFSAQNCNGFTALHMAVFKENLPNVKYLTQRMSWSMLLLKDKSDRTAKDLAKELNLAGIEDVIKNKKLNPSSNQTKPQVKAVIKRGFFQRILSLLRF